MLSFQESCWREGQVWATSGYSFCTGKIENDNEFNKHLYKNVINLTKYLHFYSGKKASSFTLIILLIYLMSPRQNWQLLWILLSWLFFENASISQRTLWQKGCTRPLHVMRCLLCYSVLISHGEKPLLGLSFSALWQWVFLSLLSIFVIIKMIKDSSWPDQTLNSWIPWWWVTQNRLEHQRYAALSMLHGFYFGTRKSSQVCKRCLLYHHLKVNFLCAMWVTLFDAVAFPRWYTSLTFQPSSPARDDVTSESEPGYVSPTTDKNMGLGKWITIMQLIGVLVLLHWSG